MTRASRLLQLAFGGTIALLCGCAFRATEFSAARSARVTAAGVSVLRIDAGAGYLRVLGESTSPDIVVDGIAHAGTAPVLDRVQLVTRKAGDTLVVACAIPPRARPTDITPMLDLTVRTPRGIALDVVDSSGGAYFRGVSALRVRHGDGRLAIDSARGNVDIVDGSGDMVISNVIGNVRVFDGAGAIRIYNVRGSVSVPRAGAGDITVFGVSGNVAVGEKSSGEVLANGVGGNLTVAAKGNGSIEYRNVRGRVLASAP